MSKAPNEAQGRRCQSPAALLRPSGEQPLDAIQHELVVAKPSPESNGEFEYRIKSVNEPHERVVWESELQGV
jgi:hypothetical protein